MRYFQGETLKKLGVSLSIKFPFKYFLLGEKPSIKSQWNTKSSLAPTSLIWAMSITTTMQMLSFMVVWGCGCVLLPYPVFHNNSYKTSLLRSSLIIIAKIKKFLFLSLTKSNSLLGCFWKSIYFFSFSKINRGVTIFNTRKKRKQIRRILGQNHLHNYTNKFWTRSNSHFLCKNVIVLKCSKVIYLK